MRPKIEKCHPLKWLGKYPVSV